MYETTTFTFDQAIKDNDKTFDMLWDLIQHGFLKIVD